MSNERSRAEIRVLKKNDVADCVNDVLKDKTDVADIQSALHLVHSRYNKAQYIEREVFHEVLRASMLLTKAVKNLSAEVAELKIQMAGQVVRAV